MVQFKKEEKGKTDFRDRLATIDEKGRRVWVYAKKPNGQLTFWRNIVGFALLIFFFAAPFIRIHNEPLLLLNFIDREIVLLGVRFWPILANRWDLPMWSPAAKCQAAPTS